MTKLQISSDEWWKLNLQRKKDFRPGDLVKPYEFFEDAIVGEDPAFLRNFRIRLGTIGIVLCSCSRFGNRHIVPYHENETMRLMVLMCDGRICWWDEMYTELT